MVISIFALLLLACGSEAAVKTLILIENYGVKETHSVFLNELTSSGHELTYKMADDSTLVVFQFGDLLYDNIVVLAPSTQDFGGEVNAGALAAFVDKGGNILIAGDSTIGDAIRDFGYECGVEFEEAGTFVIDHLNFDVSDEGAHSRLTLDKSQVLKNELLVGKFESPILYEGIGLVLDEENELLINVLSATATSYSFFPQDKIAEHPEAVGRSTALVAALQARNNARVVFTGSFEMLSDKFILSAPRKTGTEKVYPKSGNGEFVKALVKWAFKEVGVLRITEVKHRLQGERSPPQYYTVLENAEFIVNIEELVNGKWVEFKNKDVQMDFVRIDPFVRMNLVKENGSYVGKFKLPDVYGVFQFKVNYQRQGYTYLTSATQVSVRPLQHTQYERFIPVAYPYYVSAFSMMFGVLVFSVVFLHFKEPSTSSKQKSS
jgi:oligosaccharyltransferase complex subunit beta